MKSLIVVISGNRGLCGGYNSEVLARLASGSKSAAGNVYCAAVGRVAREYCAANGIEFEYFDIPDVPSYSDSKAACGIYPRRILFRQSIRRYGRLSAICEYAHAGAGIKTAAPARGRQCRGRRNAVVADRAAVSEGLTEQCTDAALYKRC